MTIILGGVELNTSMEWLERYAKQPVAQVAKRTLGGGVYVSAINVNGGRICTLEATEDHGWLTRTQLEAVEAMAEDAGGVYTLQFNGVEYSVVFRHHESPAVDFKPLIARTADASSDYYIGQIKLLIL